MRGRDVPSPSYYLSYHLSHLLPLTISLLLPLTASPHTLSKAPTYAQLKLLIQATEGEFYFIVFPLIRRRIRRWDLLIEREIMPMASCDLASTESLNSGERCESEKRLAKVVARKVPIGTAAGAVIDREKSRCG